MSEPCPYCGDHNCTYPKGDCPELVRQGKEEYDDYINRHADDPADREGWSEGDYNHDYYSDDLIDGVGFADPGGRSALRAATPNNPKDQPCPTCGAENVLTRIDVQRRYQCDRCADRAEGRFGGDY